MTTLSALALLLAASQEPRTLRVPGDHPAVQAAVDAARDGDTVLLEPGVYKESIKVARKSITIASRFLATQDPKDVEGTVLDGGGTGKKDGAPILRIEKNAGEVRIVGLTFRHSAHAVSCHGKAQVLHNRFLKNGDALSFESGSGIVRSNLFEQNHDDGIDLDGSSEALIEDNVIRNNRDDGIEVRLHDHKGALLQITIRRNLIAGNGEDGIQLIDYPGKSNRIFRIERNVLVRNAMAAVGMMSDGNTKENYEGADLPEPVLLLHNTFVENHYGVTGGDNTVLVNNIFLGTAKSALKKVDGDSAFAHNLFWKNGADLEECDLDLEGKLSADPLLDEEHRLRPGSPCIDAGTLSLGQGGQKLVLPADRHLGKAPDLGAFEFAEKSP